MSDFPRKTLSDLGLLALRLGVGGMMLLGHGWPKLSKFSALADKFPDPLGVGSQLSLIMAVFGEVFCAALLMLGLLTRLAAIPFLTTMLVAAIIIHGGDPWAKKELALLYAVPAVTLLLTGPGGLSLDAWRRGR